MHGRFTPLSEEPQGGEELSTAVSELLPSVVLGGGVGVVVGAAVSVVVGVLTVRRVGRETAATVKITNATNERLERIEHILTSPDQAWYWTEQWQAGEAEADADRAAGRGTVHRTEGDFLAALDEIPAADSPSGAKH
jgi:hypothetical protein